MRRWLPDLRDVFVFGGLAAVGTGLWWFRPWVSLTVVGLIVMALGIVPVPGTERR